MLCIKLVVPEGLGIDDGGLPGNRSRRGSRVVGKTVSLIKQKYPIYHMTH